jgi:hypothetical protein
VGFLSAYSGTKRVDIDGRYWVDVLECLSIVDKQRAEKALATPRIDMNGQGDMALDTVAFHNVMMNASIIGWNLDDDDGTVWALTPARAKEANIARLPAPVYDQVWQVVDELNGPRERTEQVRFPGAGVGGDQVGDGGPAEPEQLLPGDATVAAPGAAPVGPGVPSVA